MLNDGLLGMAIGKGKSGWELTFPLLYILYVKEVPTTGTGCRLQTQCVCSGRFGNLSQMAESLEYKSELRKIL
jgi:hypothetical protein